ncbi:MAG TPA: beta-propeller fold lactonase family protein [Fimbriimonadaceae bacterium]|nr:beta-propeller fold lactonase family protein [Fimbriimonadaceae bacterium]
MALSLAALGAVLASAAADGNAVYIETNDASNNQVLVYTHGGNGVLSLAGSYSTGGLGTGAAQGLGSQGAVTLSEDGRLLFAVDAGSNDIAVFRVDGPHLHLAGNFPSGGTKPISVTESRRLVYVLDAGGDGNIAGFRSDEHGNLEPVTLSSRPLSGAGVAAVQIQFDPWGDALVVMEKGTNTIDTWPMFGDRPGFLYTNPSNGAAPFGFDFDNRGHLIVSEAAASAASSYQLGQAGWSVISGSVANNQAAACWLTVTPNGKYAYTANAGNGTLSGYAIGHDGSISLLTAGGLTATVGAGSHPVDMGFGSEGEFLYVLANGNGTIAEFRVHPDGSLTSIGTVTGLPISVQGLAAR